MPGKCQAQAELPEVTSESPRSLGPMFDREGQQEIAFAELLHVVRQISFGNRACSHSIPQPANLDNIKVVDEFSDQLRRSVVAGLYAVTAKLAQHDVSVSEVHRQ